MTKKTIKQINQFIDQLDQKHFNDDYSNCLNDFLTNDFLEELEQEDPKKCFEDIYEELSREFGFFDIDVIYYSKAIKYLQDNDSSFTNSLQLASDHGYEAKDLNCQILANILLNNSAIETFYSLRNQIIEFFED
ncbi:hypothetical protein N9O56_01775 [Rickettsiales bacterium]|nr:hypothetical protein [Rickettsiales bacterium]